MYDLIIIGGGPAGYAAALYAARAEINTLVLEGSLPGGRISLTDIIENYPGVKEKLSGFDLSQIMKNQAIEAGAEFKMENVEKFNYENNTFYLKTYSSEYSKIPSVLIATGTNDKKLSVPGEKEFTGRGVSYCATCDGPFFKDKKVAVIGGGDSAVKEALFLTKIAKEVIVVHRRDKLRAEKIIQKKAFNTPNMYFQWDSIVEEIIGNNSVEKIKLKNVKDNNTKTIEIDGVFILIGSIPNNSLFKDLNITDKTGYILTDENMKTSIKGLYAAGDIRVKSLRQVATAVGDGATAAVQIQEYLETL